MNELVFKSEKGTPVTTSLLVAQKFGKRHADVIRAIEDVARQTPENECKRNFALMSEINELPLSAILRSVNTLTTAENSAVLSMHRNLAAQNSAAKVPTVPKVPKTLKKNDIRIHQSKHRQANRRKSAI
jgi:phage regulator Rha-like protein